MKIPKWLGLVQTVGLAALQASPLAPIAPEVASLIRLAEGEGGTGKSKLDRVLAGAVTAASIAQKSGVNISPEVVASAGAAAVSTAIQVTNIVHQAQSKEAGAVPVEP